jgi:hypothetical protein
VEATGGPGEAVPPPSPIPASARAGSGAAPELPKGLITLERPFDLDSFSQLLGETVIQVTVPREDLPELLRRVCDFMGFGIYVYAVSFRPAAHEMLRSFEVELRRVEYSPTEKRWTPFSERGRADAPFGPRS